MGLGGSWLEEQEGCPLVDRLESYLGESTHRTWQLVGCGNEEGRFVKEVSQVAGRCVRIHTPFTGAEGRTDCDYFFPLSLITSPLLSIKRKIRFSRNR